jgi:hypothetical protein
MTNEKFKVEGDLIKDGRIKFTREVPVHGYLGGYYVKVANNATEEEINKAKEDVVDAICCDIRRIASERDDFFIIKEADDCQYNTIAAKFELPTVKSI